MNLELNPDETHTLATELRHLIDAGRYPFSLRIRTLRTILDRLEPPPVRAPLPPSKWLAPPRATPSQRRRPTVS